MLNCRISCTSYTSTKFYPCWGNLFPGTGRRIRSSKIVLCIIVRISRYYTVHLRVQLCIPNLATLPWRERRKTGEGSREIDKEGRGTTIFPVPHHHHLRVGVCILHVLETLWRLGVACYWTKCLKITWTMGDVQFSFHIQANCACALFSCNLEEVYVHRHKADTPSILLHQPNQPAREQPVSKWTTSQEHMFSRSLVNIRLCGSSQPVLRRSEDTWHQNGEH